MQRLHDAGYQVVGLTSLPYTYATLRYTGDCLKDAGIAFKDLSSFEKSGIEFQAGENGFIFKDGVIFCGDERDKTAQARLFLAHNYLLGYIKPATTLHLTVWDNNHSVIKNFLKDKNFSPFGLSARPVSKHGVSMSLEDLLETSFHPNDWNPNSAVTFLLNSFSKTK